MECKVVITQCDVCKRKKNKEFEVLVSYGWTKYKYQQEWVDGAHSGTHELDMHVCNKCRRKSYTAHLLLSKIKQLCRI